MENINPSDLQKLAFINVMKNKADANLKYAQAIEF